MAKLNRSPRFSRRERIDRPYATARAFLAIHPSERLHVSDQRLNQYRAVAALPHAWGERLDTIGATMRQARWVGHGDSAAMREARYRALVAFLEGDDTRATSFEALKQSMPKVPRHTLPSAKASANTSTAANTITKQEQEKEGNDP